jgi:ABC-type Zn uptake system ZnuABC Zn-binding protein ZnuA
LRTILTFLIASLVAAGSLPLAGCGSETNGSGLAVVATTPQVADLTRNIVGDAGSVDQILAANADPHAYEPEPSDAEALAGADLIVRSGGDVDQWTEQLVDSSGTGAPVLTLIDHVETIEAGGETDPHWWQDPRNAIMAVGAIRDELVEIDPAEAATFEANAKRYLAELSDLDAAIAMCMDRIPASERMLVTSHDALGYYANRYGIDVVGAAIPALSTEAQASAGETADLVDLIRRTGVTTIYPEAGVPQGLEQAIAGEAGAKVGSELWADTLGQQGSPADTYLGAIRANTETLLAGFENGGAGCDLAG